MSVYQCQIVRQDAQIITDSGVRNVPVNCCGHKHRTISAALKCLRRLQWRATNWAVLGDVYDITDGHSRPLCDDDAETLDALMRAGR